MFREKSAWFSKSVSPNSRTFWIVQGGTVTGWKTADYIFSEDATCQDTLRIFLSKDYLLNKVTVFHSEFLSACERRQSVRSVSIGHYVLPPVSVQDGENKYMFIFCYIAMDALPKYLGDLCDFYPKCSHCSNCGACTSTITNMKDS
uniref:Telomere repeat binding bouquet formation protein 2 n=1 Tax=Cynoglossus semilaevis TaxID=244447 RepID=A0A3P8UIN3_CYNSE